MDQFAVFYMITASCGSTICGNAFFFLLDGLSTLVKDKVTIGVWVHFWVFDSIPLIYLLVSVTIPNSFYPY